jgi:hypothetical protein
MLKRKKTQSLKVAMVFLLILSICLSSQFVPVQKVNAATYTYQASSAFNNGLGIQGKDSWYYMQWNGSSYSNLSWSNTNQLWQGSQTYLSVTATTMHPESNYDAIRKWVVPCDGTARITGNVRKYDIDGGDGVSVKIIKNATDIWGIYNLAYNDNVGLNHDVTTDVKNGDVIYFLVNRRTNIYNDSTYWDPSIQFTSAASNTLIKAYEFTSSDEGWSTWNCSKSASGGYLNLTVTGADPSISSPDNLNIDITKTSILKVKFKNQTSSNVGCIYFTTTEDSTFTQAKAKTFAITPNDSNYTEYTIDMSDVYGWLGKIKQLRIDPSEASSGSYSIDYIRLNTGGSNSPAFSIMDKEVVFDNNTLKNVLNLDFYTDSSMGVIRNSDATYKFIGSNGGATHCTTITSGDLNNPASTINANQLSIGNTPTQYGYVSAGPVYKDPSDANTMISILHLEKHYTINSVHYFDASLGLAITRNAGTSWTWCGEIIDHDLAYDTTRAASVDIGAGSFLIQNVGGVDYFYVYSVDAPQSNQDLRELSVARAPVSDVIAAAKNYQVTNWYKYYNGSFTQPGLGGSYTNIFNNQEQMNFMTVTYNSTINKYLMAYTSTRQWGSNNYSDINLIVANSPTDFNNNANNYYIDCSSKYTQYPTMVGLGNSDPQTASQKSFYIYYMQWQNDQIWNSDTNLVRKQIILD